MLKPYTVADVILFDYIDILPAIEGRQLMNYYKPSRVSSFP